MYHMAGNIGKEMNLAIWQSSTELPNLKSPDIEFSSCKKYLAGSLISSLLHNEEPGP